METAQASYQKSLAANPQRTTTYIRLGDSYYRQNKVEKALETYLQGLETIKDSPELMIRTAQAQEALGKNDAAIDNYEAALKLAPNSIIARNNLAMLYSDHAPTQTNLERAASLMRQYV